LVATAAVADAVDPIVSAWAEFRRDLLAESAGVFWIAAEIAILFCMGVALRVFGERPLPESIRLTHGEKRRALGAAAFVIVLSLFVYGRHAVLPPLPMAFRAIAASGEHVTEAARKAYLLRAHVHIALWCSMIAAWVALEIAIVVQGVRVFRRLRALVRETGA
jgi:hypothetical protein